jgi:8-oxo-dGTP pyrophosphatase MutT (NUDIX family)
MEAPKFNNKPNAHVKYYYSDECGLKIQQDFFVCRATAVVGVVFAFTDIGMKILITRRSNTMRDEANKYGIPCGYLDFNETRHEAMIREVYEETSLYLPEYEKYLLFNNDGDPYKTKDKPGEDKRQNISHIYLNVFDFSKEPDKFPKSIEAFSCKETALVKWMKLEEFYLTYPNYEWAFNHDETIKSAVIYHNKIFFGNLRRDSL